MKLMFSQLLPIQQIYPITDKLPFKTAYKFAKLGEVIESELKFFQEKMQEIITTYSEKDENGHPVLTEDGASIKIQESKVAECQQEINELNNVEADIHDIYFTIEELESLSLTTQQVYALMPLIKE